MSECPYKSTTHVIRPPKNSGDLMVSCKSAVNDITPTIVPNVTVIATRYDDGGDFSQVSVAAVSGNTNYRPVICIYSIPSSY
jgi:hypothetical protein